VVGWFLKAGSVLSVGAGTGITMINMHLAAATAACRSSPNAVQESHRWMVWAISVCRHHAACGFVDVKGALIIGFAAGIVCYWASPASAHVRRDDALDRCPRWAASSRCAGVFAMESSAVPSQLLDGNPARSSAARRVLKSVVGRVASTSRCDQFFSCASWQGGRPDLSHGVSTLFNLPQPSLAPDPHDPAGNQGDPQRRGRRLRGVLCV
jgi:hypothetical protein